MREMVFQREVICGKAACRLLGVLVFIMLISLGAFVRIPLPFTPVPLTLQTFFVLLSAAFLGSFGGSLVTLGYILIGALGLPVFTGAGSGYLYLAGPTAGYLFGFVFAALFVGRYLRYAGNSLIFILGVVFIGDLIILASGVVWMRLILGYPMGRLLFLGFIPFIPGDLFKAIVASWLYQKAQARLRQIF